MTKKTIVISAINIFEGGPLSILNESLRVLSSEFASEYTIIALVHDKQLAFFSNIQYIEFPKSRKSYLIRLYYEYFYFKSLSKKLKPFLWFSLHDITPNVDAQIRAVYCHNPSPFYKANILDWKYSPTVSMFSLFYKFLYRINLKKNKFVVVQQQWIADSFMQLFKMQNENFIVAKPFIKIDKVELNAIKIGNTNFEFFFPSFPRTFKNFEIVCEACNILEKNDVHDFLVYLTIDGSENSYSRWIVKKYSHLKNIRFLGLISKEEVFRYYYSVDCLIFPSRLETWGLPISEFTNYNKPMLLADLPYAYETSCKSTKTSFFNPNDALELSRQMGTMINGDNSILTSVEVKPSNYTSVDTWGDLFNKLLS